MARRQQRLLAAGALLLAAGARGADAALLEAMAGCTLKPAQNLRVVSAEPTRLSFSFTSPPGTSPACVDHFVASIYEAGSIQPLFEDVVVAPPAPAAPTADASAAAALGSPPPASPPQQQPVTAFSFGGLEPAHEYRAIVTAVPAAGAASDYARAVAHAAAVLVTVTPRDVAAAAAEPVVQRQAAPPAGGGVGGGGGHHAAAPQPLEPAPITAGPGGGAAPAAAPATAVPPRTGRPVMHVMPPPSPRPLPLPPPAAAPAPAPAAPKSTTTAKPTTKTGKTTTTAPRTAPRAGPGSGRATRPSGGRQDFRPAGAAPDHRAPESPTPAVLTAGAAPSGRGEGADAAAASAGRSPSTAQLGQKQQQQHKSGKHDDVGVGETIGIGSADLGGAGGGGGGDFAMAADGRGRRRGGGGHRAAGGHGGHRRANVPVPTPTTDGVDGDSDNVLVIPPQQLPEADQDSGAAAAPAAAGAASGAMAPAPGGVVTLEPWATEALDFAARQLANTVQDIGLDSPSVPRSAQPGVGVRMEEVVSEKGVLGWTAGFFPGSLWLLYEYLSVYAVASGGGAGSGAAANAKAPPAPPAAARAPVLLAAAAPAPGAPSAGAGHGRRPRGGARSHSGGRRAGARASPQEEEQLEEASPSPSPEPAPAPAPPSNNNYPPIYGDPLAAKSAAADLLAAARSFTDLMEPVQRVTNDHDVGFVAYCSYGQGLRVLEEQEREQAQGAGAHEAAHATTPAAVADPMRAADLAAYRAALLRSADALATRFDPDVGATASWDWWGKRGRDYPVIVDNMMNMELLFWAEKEHARAAGELRARAAAELRRLAKDDENKEDDKASAVDMARPARLAEGEEAANAADADAAAAAAAAAEFEARADLAQAQASRLRHVAESHLRTTLANHFRNDAGGTAWHLVNYDPLTGKVWRRQNYQGYDDDSMWARGQGWALYGFSFAFRETGDRLFLRRAVRLAEFLYSHANMPADGVPYWDYTDPRIPDVPRDASAGAIYASALYELSRHVRGDEGEGAWDGGSGGGAFAAAAGGNNTSNATANLAITFPVAPRETEAAADARWASLSAQEQLAAGDALRARLRGHADRTLASLALAAADGGYRETVVGANDGFVLRHSVGSLNERLMLEIDAPLNYADYYFLEAMLRRVQTRAELEARRVMMREQEEKGRGG